MSKQIKIELYNDHFQNYKRYANEGSKERCSWGYHQHEELHTCAEAVLQRPT